MPAKIEVRSEAQDAAAHRVSTPTTRVAIFRGDTAKQQELAALYNDPQKSFFLFGSKLKYTPDGRILFKRYHPATGERFKAARDEGKRPKDKRATPGSPRSRYQPVKQEEYVEIRDVEAGLRLTGHVGKSARGKEARQAKAVAKRADRLLRRLGEAWGKFTQQDIEKFIQDTYAMFASESMDPQKLKDYDKIMMVQALTRGSNIYDRLGRPNYLVTFNRLKKAFEAAMQRAQALANIDVKYEGDIRIALKREREIARRTLENVRHYADPKAGIPASVLFKRTGWADQRYQARSILAVLDRLEHQMKENIHMNSHRRVAIEAAALLAAARPFIEHLARKKKTEYYDFDVILRDLATNTFPKVYNLISEGLEATKDIYPPGKRRGVVYISQST